MVIISSIFSRNLRLSRKKSLANDLNLLTFFLKPLQIEEKVLIAVVVIDFYQGSGISKRKTVDLH